MHKFIEVKFNTCHQTYFNTVLCLGCLTNHIYLVFNWNIVKEYTSEYTTHSILESSRQKIRTKYISVSDNGLKPRKGWTYSTELIN